MSTDPTGSSPPSERTLQFDHAETGERPANAPTCAACKTEIRGVYYSTGTDVVCEPCRNAVESHQTGGSGSARFARALGLGVAAAALGAAIYYAVLAITGYEIGLIAIVVGFLVGAAVNKGSRGRGGWVYQTLAIALTYSAIVVTYIPFIVKEFSDRPAATSVRDSAAAPAKLTPPAADPAPDSGRASAADSARARTRRQDANDINPFVALGLLFLLAAAAPFLAGLDNIIGILIIGFALWEAWKMNRRVPMQIEGPFRLAAAPPSVGAS
jgi:hypothetical protein